MARYLLKCECGADVPVEAGHAGSSVACSCGRTLEVPTLRALRHLPREKGDSPARPSSGATTWGARQGIVTLCLLAILVLGIAGAWSRWGEPTLPEFDPVAHTGQIERNIDALTPIEAWQLWTDFYRPLADAGFAEMRHPHEDAIRADIERRRFFQTVLLVLGALLVVVALVALFWPRRATKAPR